RSTGGTDAAAEESHHRDSRPGTPGDQQCFVESSRCRYDPHAPHEAAPASAGTWTTAGLQDEEDAAPRSATEGRELASRSSREGTRPSLHPPGISMTARRTRIRQRPSILVRSSS